MDPLMKAIKDARMENGVGVSDEMAQAIYRSVCEYLESL